MRLYILFNLKTNIISQRTTKPAERHIFFCVSMGSFTITKPMVDTRNTKLITALGEFNYHAQNS